MADIVFLKGGIAGIAMRWRSIGKQCGYGSEQAVELRNAWLHGPEKSDIVFTLNQQGREIVDIDIPDQIGLVFDIDPDEKQVAMTRGELAELMAVLAAHIAPRRAQAGDDPRILS